MTCGAVVFWKEIQCGHFIDRRHMATRFDPDNCHPQCVSCNVFKSGNIPMYERYLEQLKPGLVEELKDRAINGHFEPDFTLIKSEIKLHLAKISTPDR